MFALVNGHNFYVSCERLFRPSLLGQAHGASGRCGAA
jgi:hypothetical protein